MSTTTNMGIRRGICALLLSGAAAGLIGLAASGTAGATPWIPHVPVIPPGDPAISQFVQPGDQVALNPQPLPPRIFRPGADFELNPQPLPPGPPDPELWMSRLLPGF
jgi:hypothetical protein